MSVVCSVSAVAPLTRDRRMHSSTSRRPTPRPRPAGATASSRSSGSASGADAARPGAAIAPPAGMSSTLPTSAPPASATIRFAGSAAVRVATMFCR